MYLIDSCKQRQLFDVCYRCKRVIQPKAKVGVSFFGVKELFGRPEKTDLSDSISIKVQDSTRHAYNVE